MSKKILVTSALPYANSIPHCGNLIGSTLSADFFARYSRLQGRDTLYISGVDCYGTAAEVQAKLAGVHPSELCDKFHKLHQEIYSWFNISFDNYGKTTTDIHTQITQDIARKLDEKGLLSRQFIEQLYCENCQMALADRFVTGKCPHCREPAKGDQCDSVKCSKILHATDLIDPVCTVCKKTPELRKSEHTFFAYPQDALEKWLSTVSHNWPANAQAVTASWLKEGLHPRCITRDLTWGTPVKGSNQVYYVWFDAPIGYISITANFRDDWADWWKNPENVEHYEFMGKDNIPFHTLFFPSTLLSTGENWTLPTKICATEYLNFEGKKFSKSNSVGIFADQAMQMGLPADYWRFYLAYFRPEKTDSNFEYERFIASINELSNKFGNLAYRVQSLIEKWFDNVFPNIDEISEFDQDFIDRIHNILADYFKAMDQADLRDGLNSAIAMAAETNYWLYAKEPWKVFDLAFRKKVVNLALRATVLSSLALSPFIPGIHQEFLQQLNVEQNVSVHWLTNKFGKLSTAKPLIDKKLVKEKLKIYF